MTLCRARHPPNLGVRARESAAWLLLLAFGEHAVFHRWRRFVRRAELRERREAGVVSAQLAAREGDAVGAHAGAGSGGRTLMSALQWAAIGAGAVGVVVGAVVVAPLVLGVGTAAAGAALLGGTSGIALGVLGGALTGAAGGIGLQRETEKLGAPKLGGGCSAIDVGSPNVMIECKPAGRAQSDTNAHGKPQKLAHGSGTVFVNGKPLARLEDKSCCGGKVIASAARTWIGGPPADGGAGAQPIAAGGSFSWSDLDTWNWEGVENGLNVAGLLIGAGAITAGLRGVAVGVGGMGKMLTTKAGLSATANFAGTVGAGVGVSVGLSAAGGEAGAAMGASGALAGALAGEAIANAVNPWGRMKSVGSKVAHALRGKTAPVPPPFKATPACPSCSSGPTNTNTSRSKSADASASPPASWQKYVVRKKGFDAKDDGGKLYGTRAEEAVQRELADPRPKRLAERMDAFAEKRRALARELGEDNAESFGRIRDDLYRVNGREDEAFTQTNLHGDRYGDIGKRVAKTHPGFEGYRVTTKIDGADIELTSVNEYLLMHTPAKNVPTVMNHADPLYRDIEAGKYRGPELVEKVGELHWLMAHAMPYQRGSAGATDMMTKYLFMKNRVEPPPFKSGTAADGSATTIGSSRRLNRRSKPLPTSEHQRRTAISVAELRRWRARMQLIAPPE